MKGKDLKNKPIKFLLQDKEYELNLDMNFSCELEEVYGDVDQAFQDIRKAKLKAVRAFICAAVRVEEPDVTLKEVGKRMTLADMDKMVESIYKAVDMTMPDVKDEEEVKE